MRYPLLTYMARVLLAIYSAGRATVSDLMLRTRMSSSTLFYNLRKLEAVGYIRYDPDTRQYVITDDGRRAVEEMVREIRRWVDGWD